MNDHHERLVAARMASAIDELDPEPARRLARQQTAWVIEARLQYYREYRPGGWQARIAVEGMDRITALRSQSRPMILWVADQIFASLVVKKGLYQAGVPVHHVSAPSHGLSPTRFGRRFFKRIVTRVEDRYIVERVPYRQSRPAKAVAAMHRILRDRCVLSITAGVGDRSQVPVPILDGASVFPLSLGPVKLAWRTGAALLPCYIERASDGSFMVHVTPPLEVASSDDVTVAAADTLRAFGRQITPAISAQPAIWRFWPATSDA